MKLSDKQKIVLAATVLVVAIPVATMQVNSNRRVSKVQKEVKSTGSKTVFFPITQSGSKIIVPFLGHAKNGTYRVGYGWHTGIDYIMNRKDRGLGEPLYAIADGVVLDSTPILSKWGYGHMLLIDHPQLGVQSRYGHLQQKSTLKKGDTVKAGQLVARMGMSGTDNVHLHFDIIQRALPWPRYCPKEDKVATERHFTDPVKFFQKHAAKNPGGQK